MRPYKLKETIMTNVIQPRLSAIKHYRAQRAYNKMIKASQKKLAETTPVSYSRVIA
jgi:hypothetical protein